MIDALEYIEQLGAYAHVSVSLSTFSSYTMCLLLKRKTTNKSCGGSAESVFVSEKSRNF